MDVQHAPLSYRAQRTTGFEQCVRGRGSGEVDADSHGAFSISRCGVCMAGV